MPPQNSATIAATAAVTLVIAGVAALIFQIVKKWKQKDHQIDSSFRRQETTETHEQFHEFGGRVKGSVVDEDGKEVLYTRKREATFPNIVLNPSFEEDEGKIMDISVQRSTNPCLLLKEPYGLSGSAMKAAPVQQNSTQPSPRLLTQPPPPPPLPEKKVPEAAALPPVPSSHTPPLCHPSQVTLPPIREKINPMPVPAPPKALNLSSPLKPPPAQKGNADKIGEGDPADEGSNGNVVGQVKLKPLHWDKVATNFDDSVVWNEIKDGSLRFDDEQIENMFGYSTVNCKLYEKAKISTSSGTSSAAPTTPIFILEPRKSQNTEILLRSLPISHKEIIEALIDGQGLSSDILEKLAKMSPSQEEASKILQFNGNPSKLAVA